MADAGTDGDAGTSCEDLAACEVTFSYPVTDGIGSVELRGDFAADGWESGVALSVLGDLWQTSIEIDDGRTIRYKFVLNGTDWVPDPANPRTGDDGFDGVNSLHTTKCDGCSEVSAGYDWRDGIMYFVFVDRFADGDLSNNDPVPDVRARANYHGGDLAGVLEKIEEGYFTDLGVNVLWLTAPVDNGDGGWSGD